MASKHPRKPVSNKADEETTISIRVEPTSDTDALYANHVEVAHNIHEFTLSFTRIPAKFPRDIVESGKAAGVIVLEPKIQIMLPPTLIKPLIKALETQRFRYEEDMDNAQEKEGE